MSNDVLLEKIKPTLGRLEDVVGKVVTKMIWEQNVYGRMSEQMQEFQSLILNSVSRNHPNAQEVIRQGRVLWETANEMGESVEELSSSKMEEGELIIELMTLIKEYMNDNNPDIEPDDTV